MLQLASLPLPPGSPRYLLPDCTDTAASLVGEPWTLGLQTILDGRVPPAGPFKCLSTGVYQSPDPPEMLSSTAKGPAALTHLPRPQIQCGFSPPPEHEVGSLSWPTPLPSLASYLDFEPQLPRERLGQQTWLPASCAAHKGQDGSASSTPLQTLTLCSRLLGHGWSSPCFSRIFH